MSSTETPDINKKKDDTTAKPTSNLKSIGSFLLLFVFFCVLICAYFTTSGLVLYACKLAQSNILPTDINCSPYTEQTPNIAPVWSNIFKTSSFVDPQQSMKIQFPYNETNKNNIFLDMLRSFKEDPDSNFFSNYYIEVTESLMSFQNTSFNFVLNSMNQFLPESVIVVLGPMLMAFVSNIIFLASNVYALILWVTKASWFLKKNENANTDKPPNWISRSFVKEPVSYLFFIWLMLSFLTVGIIILVLAFPLVSILPFITHTITIFSGLCYQATITGEQKPITAGGVITRLFKYYKVMIMSILSFMVTVCAFSRLGAMEGIWSIVITVLIIWGFITIEIFKPVNPTYLTALASDAQATKTKCKSKIETPKGFFAQLFSPRQSGGGNLMNEIKKVGKKMRTTI